MDPVCVTSQSVRRISRTGAGTRLVEADVHGAGRAAHAARPEQRADPVLRTSTTIPSGSIDPLSRLPRSVAAPCVWGPPQTVQHFPSPPFTPVPYPRIIASIILNRVIAESACGVLTGRMIIPPSVIRCASSATQISHSPSMIVTTAA